MMMIDFYTIRAADICCSIKCQFNQNDYSLYYNYEISDLNDFHNLNIFFELLTKMSKIQRQFFLEPLVLNNNNPDENVFVYCPVNDLSSLYFEKHEKNDSLTFCANEKLYLMKWIFSFICGIQILLNNEIKLLKIFQKSIFLDSNMEARVSFINNHIEENTNSLFSMAEYFLPPENFKKNSGEIDLEKKYVFSLGVFILSYLTKKLPNYYFESKTKDEITKILSEGEVFLSHVPECPLKGIITKCLDKDPKQRPKLSELIELFLKEENCLDDSKFTEFINWVKRKFSIEDNSQIVKEIIQCLNEKVRDDVKYSNQPQKFKVSNFQYFLELSKGMSFESKLTEDCEKVLNDLSTYILINKFQTFFLTNRTKKNQYKLMELCLEHYFDDDLNFSNKECINLFSLENMIDHNSFFLKLSKSDNSIRFVLSKKIRLCNEHFDLFNDNELFVHGYQGKHQEIVFYPFLNIYSIFFKNSLNEKIKFETKLKWLHQTAKALQTIHEKGFTMKYFNSTYIFIDGDLNAHLFPFQMTRIESIQISDKFKFDYSNLNEFNYIISFCAPELISGTNRQINYEKHIVYSFGIFMMELLYDIHRHLNLNTLPQKEIFRILTKDWDLTIRDGQIDGELFAILKSCLAFNPVERKSFKEIFEQLNSYILKRFNSKSEKKENDKWDFLYNDLQNANAKGAAIVEKIHECLYNYLSNDEKFQYNYYMTNSLTKCSKFDLLWLILNGSEINYEVSRYDPTQMKKLEIIDIKPQYMQFYEYSKPLLQVFENTMRKVKNKTNLSFCHFGGLNERSTKQLMIRSIYNLNREFRQKVEFSVKNSFNLPYGDDLKMKNINQFFNEFKNKNILSSDMDMSKAVSGNITILSPPL